MRCCGRLLWPLALSAVVLRVFTFEYALADDPTCGVAAALDAALRAPAVVLARSPDGVVWSGEDGYPVMGIYRALRGGGWLLVVLAACAYEFASWLYREEP
jgi:hypothetical protein